MERNEFDDIIKQKLENVAETPDARAWDLFTLAALEKGENEIFDDTSTDYLVKNALNDFKIEYDALSWDALVHKMDQPTAEDPMYLQKQFDKQLSNSLKNVTRKYDASSWPKLAARIEAEEKYLRHYYRAKFVEACVFIFLLLSLVQLGEQRKITIPFTKQNTSDQTSYPSENKNHSSSYHHETKPLVTLPALPNAPKNAETKSTTYSTLFSGILKETGKNLIANTSLIKQSITEIIKTAPKETNTHFSKKEIIPFSLPPITFSNQKLNSLLEDKNSIHEAVVSLCVNDKKFQSIKPIDNLLNDIHEIKADNTVLTSTLPSVKSLGSWKIGAYTRFDYNEMYLPTDVLEPRGAVNEIRTVYAKTVKSWGYSSGFKALYEKNRIGLEFGAGYANKSYAPERVYSGNPDNYAYFQNIEYDIVEIPLSLRYKSKGNTRLTSFAQVGLNSNFIAKAFYDVIVEPKFAASSNAIGGFDSQASRFKATITDEFKKPDKSKVMAYAQGSVGLLWRLNEKIDLSSQLTYSQRFLTKKFGPNFDQSKSLSIELGLKTRL